MQPIRILDMPPCQMVSSGIGMFGEEKFDRFAQFLSAQKRGLFPKDYLFFDMTGFHWLYQYEPGMDVPSEFDIIDFPGGLYAVATDIDQQTDREKMDNELSIFLKDNHLVKDASRKELGNIISSDNVQNILGYSQMDYYFPVIVN